MSHPFPTFAEPPASFRPLCIWHWNAPLREEVLRAQVRALAEQGWGGFLLWPKPGVEPDPLTPEWFKGVRVALEEAQAAGLHVWLGGELAEGGTLLRRWWREQPHWRGQRVHWQTLRWSRPEDFSGWPSVPHLLARVAVPTSGKGLVFPEAVVVTPFSEAELQGRLGRKSWILFQFWTEETEGLDFLNPSLALALRQRVFEAYREAVGSFFGGTVQGFFLPSLRPLAEGLAWSARLPSRLYERARLDIWKALPALVAGQGEDPFVAQARIAFCSALGHLWAETLLRPLRDWCVQEGLQLMGLAANLSPTSLVEGFGHPFPGWETFHRIGFLAEASQEPWLRLGAAFGEQFLVPTMAVVDSWRAVPQQAGNLWSQGFREMVAGSVAMSIGPALAAGEELPETLSSPLAPLRPRLTRFVARLHLLSASPSLHADIALLLPLSAFWAHWKPGGKEGWWEYMEGALTFLADWLERQGYIWDWLPEGALERALAREGSLWVGQASYRLLLLPPLTLLSQAALEALQRFVQEGGRVVALALLPWRSEEGDGPAWERRVRQLFGASPRAVRRLWEEPQVEPAVIEGASPLVAFLRCSWPPSPHAQRLLRELLTELCPPCLHLDTEGKTLPRRRAGEEESQRWLILFNPAQEALPVEILVPGAWLPERWDAEEGTVRRLWLCTLEARGLFLSYTMRPREVLILRLRPPHEGEAWVSSANFQVLEMRSLGEEMEVEGFCLHSDALFAEAHRWGIWATWQGRGPQGEAPAAEECFPEGEWRPQGRVLLPLPWREEEGRRRASFLLERRLGSLHLLAPTLEGVLCNGIPLPPAPPSPSVPGWQEMELAPLLRPGGNELLVAPQREPPCLFLGGLFRVRDLEPLTLGPWEPLQIPLQTLEQMGLPNFAGTVEYRIAWREGMGEEEPLTLEVEAECDALEVWLDDSLWGCRWLPPYRFFAPTGLQPRPREIRLRCFLSTRYHRIGQGAGLKAPLLWQRWRLVRMRLSLVKGG